MGFMSFLPSLSGFRRGSARVERHGSDRVVIRSSYNLLAAICQIANRPARNAGPVSRIKAVVFRRDSMDRDGEREEAVPDDVPLVPAAAVGFLLYPWAVQLILANPPANDIGGPPPTAR
jgi:hypothetical protein